jgi:hypothetical protein
MGTGTQRARMNEAGLFVQDAWRLRPNFTLNLGVRYELQFPFEPLNDSYSTATLDDLCGVSGVAASGPFRCNLFQPGSLGGKNPEFVQISKGTTAYATDYDNIAPSVGFAWTISPQSDGLRRLLSEEFVLRGGYTKSFNREGMNQFSSQYNANPGVVIQDPTRSVGNGNLDDGAGLPVLLRQTGRLGPAAFPLRPDYPLTDSVTQDINIFDPNIQVPWAETYTFGIQRAIGRNMAFEARYVGTRSRDNWVVQNYNERNIYENGFIDEFRQAQANLQANVAAGFASQGFRYRGPGTGTAPLPTIVAYFGGAGRDPNSTSSYSSSNFTSTTFTNQLVRHNPNPLTFVNNLLNNAGLRANAAAAGIPANWFMVNPDLQGGADLTTNYGKSRYHSLQLELRRRLSNGVQFQANYVYGNMMVTDNNTPFSFRLPIIMRRDTGNPGDITHVMKANVVYDLPFGRGRRWGSNANGLVHRLIGEWSFGINARVQSGQLVDLGNVRLVGMTADDVRGFFKLRFDHEGNQIWMMPQDVIDETIKAFSLSPTTASGYAGAAPSGRYFAPANGADCIEVTGSYGQCGTGSLVVTGPVHQEYDLSMSKRVEIIGRTNAEFRIEALNVFNHANFAPVGGIGSTRSSYEVTGLNGTNDSRIVQLVVRFNW